MKPLPGSPRPSTALARVLSKRGICSRSEAFDLIRAGRVKVNGVVARDPKMTVTPSARIELDGQLETRRDLVYVMLNKPRGVITTTNDEKGRDTIFSCFAGSSLPRLIAVGRLDKASEGLLLLTNDTTWANRITDPASHLDKTYHVQVHAVADEALIEKLRVGVNDAGEILRAKQAQLIRGGEKNSWIEIVLDEGRNRHIRRMLEAMQISVLRLIRISIGPVQLGNLPKGKWRMLTQTEVRQLGG